jgi:hypothetical protein
LHHIIFQFIFGFFKLFFQRFLLCSLHIFKLFPFLTPLVLKRTCRCEPSARITLTRNILHYIHKYV